MSPLRTAALIGLVLYFALLLFVVGGYLLYSAMFAAVGSAVVLSAVLAAVPAVLPQAARLSERVAAPSRATARLVRFFIWFPLLVFASVLYACAAGPGKTVCAPAAFPIIAGRLRRRNHAAVWFW